MSERHDPVQAAIDRGSATAAMVIKHRDALIEHMAALVMVTGRDGLEACVAGAMGAVLAAQDGVVWGGLPRPGDGADR